jgi:TnsA endonuclease-like protein
LLPTKPPVRRIPLSRRSHIIGFQPLPTGTAAHESALERDFVILTGFLKPAAIITSQPVAIVFNIGRVRRRYTPDFLVDDSGVVELIEVKYTQDLQANRGQLEPAFEAATRWAEAHSGSFRVVTERDIRGELLRNAKRLLPLRAAPLDTKMALLALTNAHALRSPTFRTLLDTLPNEPLALATLWKLIARGALRADLTVPVRFDSEVYPP